MLTFWTTRTLHVQRRSTEWFQLPVSKWFLPSISLESPAHCPLEPSQISTFDIPGAARTELTAFWTTNNTSEIAIIVRTDLVYRSLFIFYLPFDRTRTR